jgi:hypothetical protein
MGAFLGCCLIAGVVALLVISLDVGVRLDAIIKALGRIADALEKQNKNTN